MRVAFMLILSLAIGCGFTVTHERPGYNDLDQPEKDAIEVILHELTAFNTQVKQRAPPYTIEEILDKEHIHVSFEGLIFSWNYGDNLVHVSTWENLSDEQRTLVQTWFQATPDTAEKSYKKLFYEFLSVTQGAKQFMYDVLTAEWVFTHRTVFSIERDSIETALAHYDVEGRKEEMWGFLKTLCAPVIEQYDTAYSTVFEKEYFNAHFAELANPKEPTAYMYCICRWIDTDMKELVALRWSLTQMLDWLKDLPD